MKAKEEFQFLNDDLWLKYTQNQYKPLEDIKYRLDKLHISQKNWPLLKQNIQIFRKRGAIPLFLNSIDKKFWYFPSDSINKKIYQIENQGNRLYDKIEDHAVIEKGLLKSVAIEEAVTSAIYEGANSTRSQARAFITSNKKARSKDEWMLVNNYRAMQWIKKNTNFSLSNELILKIHEILSENTLQGDDQNFCGKFRNDTVYIGSHEGISHSKIEEALAETIELINDHPRFIHNIVRGILLHYFIAYIHPFFDGNGRTGRGLFYFKTMKHGSKFVELLSVSADLKEHGKKYEKAFDLVKDHELDVTYFIDFCLDSLITALNKVEKKIHYLLDISRLIELKRISTKQVSLLQKMALYKHKAITIEEYAEDINKSREFARKELKDLLKKGLLQEKKEGKKFRYYLESKKLKELV